MRMLPRRFIRVTWPSTVVKILGSHLSERRDQAGRRVAIVDVACQRRQRACNRCPARVLARALQIAHVPLSERADSRMVARGPHAGHVQPLSAPRLVDVGLVERLQVLVSRLPESLHHRVVLHRSRVVRDFNARITPGPR